jgi:iron complex outermembrane recepter protein
MTKSRLAALLFVLVTLSCQSQCERTIQVEHLDQLLFDSITVSVFPNPYSIENKSTQTHQILFTGLCAQRYEIKCWLANAIIAQKQVDLETTTLAVIEFPPSSIVLAPVNVAQKSVSAPLQKLYLRDLPATHGQSLSKIMESLPGMSSLQSGSHIAKPMFFGFTGQRIVLFKNDLRLEGQQWGTDHGPEINPYYATKIELKHGAEAIFLAGDAVGAIAQLLPPSYDDSLHWSIQWRQSFRSNGRQFSEALEVRHQPRSISGLYFRVASSFVKAGNTSTPSYVLANTGFNENSIDIEARFERKKFEILLEHGLFNSKIGIFTGAHNGNLTDLMKQIERNSVPDAAFSYQIGRPNQDIYHENESIRISYKCTKRIRIIGFLARQYDERKEYDALHTRNDSIAALDRAALELHLTHYQGQTQVIFTLSDVSKIKVLTGYQSLINTFNGRFYIPNYKRSIWFGAAEIEFKWPAHRLEATARLDQIEQTVYRNQNQLIHSEQSIYQQPAFGLSYFLQKKSPHHAEAHLTYNNRPPTINERFSNGLHHGLALYEMGDMNLTQEYATRFLALYSYTRKQFSLSGQAMAQRMSNYIHTIPLIEPTLTIRGAFPTVQYTQRDARFLGWTLRGEFTPLEKWTLGASAQMLRVHILPSNTTPAYTPGDEYRMNIRYEGKLSSNIKFFIAYQIISYQKQWRISNDMEILPPPSTARIHGVHLNGEYRHKKRQYQFGIAIDNLFNTRYRLYTDRMRYFHDALGRNIQIYFNIPIYIQK